MASLKRGLAALAAFTVAATPVGPSHAISGGTPTTEYPAVGALLPAFGGHKLCTGTLVGCRTFLTAAHCLYEGIRQITAKDQYRVYFQHAGLFAVKRVTPHPDYLRSTEFPDIAVVRLDRDVTGIRPERPLGLAELTRLKETAGTAGAAHFPYGISARIVGFGKIVNNEPGGEPPRGVKRAGCIATAECPMNSMAETHVCWRPPGQCTMLPSGAQVDGANTCGGDSGGPLFVDIDNRVRLAGVTLAGVRSNCAAPDDKPYDTNVVPFLDWIRTKAGDDIDRDSCSGVDGIDHGSALADGKEVTLSPTEPEKSADSEIDAGDVKLLRIGINGEDDGNFKFDYAIQPPEGAPAPACDVSNDGPDRYRQFAFCEIASPAQGRWSVRVKQIDGNRAAMVQVVFTTFR